MTATTKLGLELLQNAAANQVLANTTFARLNQLVNGIVVSDTVNAPPGTPVDESMYVVGTSPTGLWSGRARQLAFWLDAVGAWTFITPKNGFLVWNTVGAKFIRFNGSTWADAINTLTSALNEAPIVTLASAAAPNITAAAANTINITGTTAITSFATAASGIKRTLIFAGALTLTHNATSLVLLGNANVVTAAGDIAEFTSLGSGNWKMTRYTRAALAP